MIFGGGLRGYPQLENIYELNGPRCYSVLEKSALVDFIFFKKVLFS